MTLLVYLSLCLMSVDGFYLAIKPYLLFSTWLDHERQMLQRDDYQSEHLPRLALFSIVSQALLLARTHLVMDYTCIGSDSGKGNWAT